MNKKTTALLLAVLLLASLCACGRRSAAQTEAAEAAEATAEAEATTEATETEAPTEAETPEAADSLTPTPAPTLNWVENDDGSMTATIDNGNGGAANVTLGVAEGVNFDDLDDAAIDSTPVEPAPAPTEAPAQDFDLGSITLPDSIGPDTSTTLAEYEAMSGTEQTLFYYSFASADDFMAWYNAAKAADDAGKNYIEIGENGIVNAAG